MIAILLGESMSWHRHPRNPSDPLIAVRLVDRLLEDRDVNGQALVLDVANAVQDVAPRLGVQDQDLLPKAGAPTPGRQSEVHVTDLRKHRPDIVALLHRLRSLTHLGRQTRANHPFED